MEIYKVEIWLDGELWATFKCKTIEKMFYEWDTALVCHLPRAVTIWFE